MPAGELPELKRRLGLHAEQRLAAREPEQVLHIHAELPLNRITSVLAGWLRKLEPLGHGNPEPIFLARRAKIATPPRVMKDRHVRLELAQDVAENGRRVALFRAVGWDWASRCMDLQLCEGSLIDIAYRIRENDHPDYGGMWHHAVHALPKKIATACVDLTAALGLCFGAIDLLVTPDGRYVFLEINPNGQWAFIEEFTGLPISDAIAGLLVQGNSRSRRRTQDWNAARHIHHLA